MPNESMKGKIECTYGVSALSSINLTEKLFPPPPYECTYRRDNPDLTELTKPTYRENFEQVVSTTSGEKLPFYQRNVGDYDDYEVQTLTYREWMMMLRPRPTMLINLLVARITRAKFEERKAGIFHYDRTYTWIAAEVFKEVLIPELKYNKPEKEL